MRKITFSRCHLSPGWHESGTSYMDEVYKWLGEVTGTDLSGAWMSDHPLCSQLEDFWLEVDQTEGTRGGAATGNVEFLGVTIAVTSASVKTVHSSESSRREITLRVK